MGFSDHSKRTAREDATAMAREIADSIASQWLHASTAMKRDGLLPLGPDISGLILITRAKIKPLTEKEKNASQRILAEGFPGTPLELCKAIWEIEMETFFSPENQSIHRETAYEVMGQSLAQRGLIGREVDGQKSELGGAFVEIAREAVEFYRQQARELRVSPDSEGGFLSALLAACFVMEPGLSDEEPEGRVELVANVAALACPDLYVHESKIAEFTERIREFARSTLAALSGLRVERAAGHKSEDPLRILHDRHQEALVLSFCGAHPPDIDAFMSEVDRATLRNLEAWMSASSITEQE